MAGTAHIDRIDLLSLKEVNGAVVQMSRKALVVDLTPLPTDYQGLMRALEVAGIPAQGSTPTGTGLELLRLVERNPKVLRDSSNYEVFLEYEHILQGANQNIGNPAPAGVIYGKTKASLSQKPTNFYREQRYGFPKLITVSHTWPDNDEHGRAGQTDTQGGEIQVWVPERTLHFEGFRDTNAPWALERFLTGAININWWANEPPFYWKCMECQWQIMRRATPFNRYHFVFEFQTNYDTWNPRAVFIDPHTGRPPPNLVAETGYKDIPYDRRINFNQAFTAFFEGWSQLFFGAP